MSTRPVISKSSSLCTNPFMTVTSASITIGIIITFMFHSFFSSLARSKYLFLFLLSFSLTLWSAGTAKFTIPQVLFLFVLLIYDRSGRLVEIRCSVCISKSHSFVRHILLDRFRVVHIPFVHMVRFKLLAQFPEDHPAHPVVSSLILSLR